MSDTKLAEKDPGLVQSVREKIDDTIDILEDFAEKKLAKVPALMRPPLEMAANGAFATLRGILGIPDDIGGDED